jgi:hypothetical protein
MALNLSQGVFLMFMPRQEKRHYAVRVEKAHARAQP